MQVVGYLSDFFIAAIALALIWFVYLFCNSHLIKLSNAFLQEVLGILLSLVILLTIGVVLGVYALGLSVGIFFIFILISVKRSISRQNQTNT